jgi:hypothetical protein
MGRRCGLRTARWVSAASWWRPRPTRSAGGSRESRRCRSRWRSPVPRSARAWSTGGRGSPRWWPPRPRAWRAGCRPPAGPACWRAPAAPLGTDTEGSVCCCAQRSKQARRASLLAPSAVHCCQVSCASASGLAGLSTACACAAAAPPRQAASAASRRTELGSQGLHCVPSLAPVQSECGRGVLLSTNGWVLGRRRCATCP